MQKINKILNYITIVAILFLIGKSYIDDRQTQASLQQAKYNLDISTEDVKKYYDYSDSISLDGINSYKVFFDNNIVGQVVNTSPYSDEIYGYNSITPLTIYLDKNDKIIDIEICENRESRSYLNRVINSGFLDSWDGLSPEEVLCHKVDAVSGCTFTSVAIEQSLQMRMQEISERKSRLNSWDWNLFMRQACIMIVVILATICFFNPKKTKVLRKITLVLSIIILGFWSNSLLSLALFCNWISNGISLAIQLPLLVVALLAIILPIKTKKSFYCQYLCPFGAAQEFVGMIPLRKINVSSKVFKAFSFARKIILLTFLVMFAFGAGLDLSVVEPFPIFNYQSIGFGLAIFAAVIMIASIFFRKPWCNFLCPTGTLLEDIRTL